MSQDSATMRFVLPALYEQADLAERHGLETLLFCPNAWALRHVFINQETGETIRARCNRWDCLYCGPRKVDQWRQLVKAAEPTLFLTLSKAGNTVEESSRALTIFMRYLRRGSKGKGPHHIGERPAYPVEYFGVMERHRDFERVGFHWHLLLRGVDYIPYKEVIKPGWISATHGQAEIAHIEPIRKPHVIGYVTKYLTKSLSIGEKGTRYETRERRILGMNDTGQLVEERETYTAELVSKARRIRYSKHFFPEQVSALRLRLFAEVEQTAMEQGDVATGIPELPLVEPSSWVLVEQEQYTRDIGEYKRRRRQALLNALEDMRDGRNLSRRVIGIWDYQRHEAGFSSN